MIEITAEALSDLEKIYQQFSIQLLSPEIAKNLFNRISDKILSLDTMPERFVLIDSNKLRKLNLRMMVVNNFSVIYVIEGMKVIVTNILYSSSNIIEKLKK